MGKRLKLEILSMLRKTEGYLSGQEICRELEVSRTAVWKVMNQLKEEGYQIEAVTNRGYSLVEAPDLITAEETGSFLETDWMGQKICYFERINSTNIKAKEIADQEDTDGLLVLAEEQEEGKGRRGRSWSSPKGNSVFMSLILKPGLVPEKVSAVTLAAALAVQRAIEKQTMLKAFIKWPNDIVVNGKKVCGILTEMSSQEDYVNHIVIGIGINVNTAFFPDEIKDMATSLFLECGRRIKRAGLIAAVLKELEELYALFCENETLSFMQEEYDQNLINRGRPVRVILETGERNGTALGITESGSLLVKWEDGEVSPVLAGEVSVRGLYGYV